MPEVSTDPEAKIGAKSSNKFWYGFKKHVAVDMQSGMITRVAVTAANVTDADGAKHVMPRSGAACCDKGYVGAIREMLRRGIHPMVILKNNMKNKNIDLDRWITKLRSPYESTFRVRLIMAKTAPKMAKKPHCFVARNLFFNKPIQ